MPIVKPTRPPAEDCNPAKPDLIAVLEAAYRIRQSTEDWLKGILSAARPTMDGGLGMAAFTYNATASAPLGHFTFAPDGMSDDVSSWVRRSTAPSEDRAFESLMSVSCFTAKESPKWFRHPLQEDGRGSGIRDALVVTAVNPDGRGCALIAPLRSTTPLTRRGRENLTKVACHLAAAHRLRTILDENHTWLGGLEAILDLDGAIHHASGEATSDEARESLRAAAIAIGLARGRLRTEQPDGALNAWGCLAGGRWSLIDVRQPDGDRLAAVQNRPEAPGPPGLSRREREIVAFAAMGHSSRLIGYNLGLPSRIIDIFTARAAKTLHVRSREELIHHWAWYSPKSEWDD